VLKAICSGFEETADPPVCLSDSVQTNECLQNNGGCWSSGNLTACQVFLSLVEWHDPSCLKCLRRWVLVNSIVCCACSAGLEEWMFIFSSSHGFQHEMKVELDGCGMSRLH